jgi:hypothetical protein
LYQPQTVGGGGGGMRIGKGNQSTWGELRLTFCVSLNLLFLYESTCSPKLLNELNSVSLKEE